jgi:hypothetical protein
MSREDVIHRIVEREMRKCPLTEEAVLKEATELHQAACHEFGTWDTALQYAGVNLRRLRAEQGYTRERVIQEMRHLCRNGYNLGAMHNMRRDRRLFEAARRLFGGWKEALCCAGIELRRVNKRSKPRRLDREKILADLLQRHKAEHSMRWTHVCMEDRALATAAKNAFNGWRRALVAAGLLSPLEPRLHPNKWNRQNVIEGIQQRYQEGKCLHYKGVGRDDGGLLYAARRHFGSWNNALVAAGVEPKRGARRHLAE